MQRKISGWWLVLLTNTVSWGVPIGGHANISRKSSTNMGNKRAYIYVRGSKQQQCTFMRGIRGARITPQTVYTHDVGYHGFYIQIQIIKDFEPRKWRETGGMADKMCQERVKESRNETYRVPWQLGENMSELMENNGIVSALGVEEGVRSAYLVSFEDSSSCSSK